MVLNLPPRPGIHAHLLFSLLIPNSEFVFTDPKVLEDILINTPEQTIKFKVYKRERDDEVELDRRLRRIRNQNKLPIGVWAQWLVESIRPYTQCAVQYCIDNTDDCNVGSLAC